MSLQVIHRSCPVCGGARHRPFLEKGELRLVRCEDCNMIYADRVEEEMVTGKYYDQKGTPFYLSPNKLESDYSAVRFERELRLFRRFCPGGRVLDVGCSTGAFLFQLKQRYPGDYDVLGIDVAGPALDHAESKGVTVSRESYLSIQPENPQFTAVTFWAVLEHLVDPGKFLSKTASLVQSAGYCFILVPNFNSLAVRLLGARYRYILPQHLNYFTGKTLKQLIAGERRFRIVHSGTLHFNPLVIWQDLKRPAGFVSDEERAALLRRTTGFKQNRALKPLKMALAASESVLGRLNLADNLVVVLQKKG